MNNDDKNMVNISYVDEIHQEYIPWSADSSWGAWANEKTGSLMTSLYNFKPNNYVK